MGIMWQLHQKDSTADPVRHGVIATNFVAIAPTPFAVRLNTLPADPEKHPGWPRQRGVGAFLREGDEARTEIFRLIHINSK
jgi:hypothetical protein